MAAREGIGRIRPAWWTLILIVTLVSFVGVCSALFTGSFDSYVPVTLVSDRSGLVMESGAKVKLRGVQVGRVAAINGGTQSVSLKLDIDPGQIKDIPANVQAQIRATTAFGAKYVDLIYPENPSRQHLAAGAVLRSRNVSTEVNTVFENLVGVLHQVEPAKLNAVLDAVAEGVRGQGERIGKATTDANQVLLALNPRMDTVQKDFQSLTGFSDTYSAAAQNILAVLKAASTTATTITDHTNALDALLLSTIGFTHSGINLLGPNKDNLVRAINLLEPTTNLLMKYNPELTCVLLGGMWILKNGGWEITGGGNGYSVVTDAGLLFGDDPYQYPENLPIVAAKGGPGGETWLRVAAGREQELPRAGPGHQHRLGHRTRHPTQPRYRPPLVDQLLPGYQSGSRTADHPRLASAGYRPGSLSGGATIRRAAVRTGRDTAVSGCSAPTAARPSTPARTLIDEHEESSRARQLAGCHLAPERLHGGLRAGHVRALGRFRATAVPTGENLQGRVHQCDRPGEG
ncbi:hypothetical protein MMAN_21470 [Mycobacterium mantenii]|uniref:MCE-family protein MCE1A n=1 Tax=Mycobacterium mantenii TaxID=560555 RepID=A0ABM7JRS7_MYCNT|nr:hypothetical protein MMAN_21470 [Mycobacterium mantenii]